MADYGVNVDSEGTVVGLWFNPGVIQHDEKDYWFVSSYELRRLLETTEEESPDGA